LKELRCTDDDWNWSAHPPALTNYARALKGLGSSPCCCRTPRATRC
jgi:hypothetical protein